MKICSRFFQLIALLLITQNLLGNVSNIPVEEFFKNYDYTGLQLSPNGKYLAVMSPINNRRNIVILELENMSNAKPLTRFDKYNVGGFFWANNEEIVFTMDTTGGREAAGLYKVTISDNSKVTLLVDGLFGTSGVRIANVINRLEADPEHIIVTYNGRRVIAPDVYKLPLDSQWSAKKKRIPSLN